MNIMEDLGVQSYALRGFKTNQQVADKIKELGLSKVEICGVHTDFSKEDNFDRDIPLFGIENRDVEIVNSLDFLDRPSFVLVEGGEGMLKALQEKIDWMLIYQTPKLSTNNLTYNTTMNLHFLHQNKKDIDLMIWSKQSGH